MDYACENHGLKIMLLLRFCPIYALNLVIQLVSLMGIPYKHFVLGGFTAFIPILFKVIQGTRIDTVENLDKGDYVKIGVVEKYEYLGTVLSILLGSLLLVYHTL